MWLVKVIVSGKPGGSADGKGWDGDAIKVPGEPIAVVEERNWVRVYYRVKADVAEDEAQLKLEV
jgi:hypothetical protein